MKGNWCSDLFIIQFGERWKVEIRFSTILYGIIEISGFTYEKLAEYFGVDSRASINGWLNGTEPRKSVKELFFAIKHIRQHICKIHRGWDPDQFPHELIDHMVISWEDKELLRSWIQKEGYTKFMCGLLQQAKENGNKSRKRKKEGDQKQKEDTLDTEDCSIIPRFVPNPFPLEGREKQLAQLEAIMEESCVVCITGIAGVGKSALAKAYAQKHRKHFDIIREISSDNFKDAIQQVLNLDEVIQQESKKNADVLKVYERRITRLCARQRVLLIVHDYDKTEELDFRWDSLGCSVILTSRSPWNGVPSVKLRCRDLSQDDARRMFEYYFEQYDGLPAQLLQNNKEKILNLLTNIDCHPLLTMLYARYLAVSVSIYGDVVAALNNLKKGDRTEISRILLQMRKDGALLNDSLDGHLVQLFEHTFLNLEETEKNALRYFTVIDTQDGICGSRFGVWTKSDSRCLYKLQQFGWLEFYPELRDPLAEESVGVFCMPYVIRQYLRRKPELQCTMDNTNSFIDAACAAAETACSFAEKQAALRQLEALLSGISQENTLAYVYLLARTFQADILLLRLEEACCAANTICRICSSIMEDPGHDEESKKSAAIYINTIRSTAKMLDWELEDTGYSGSQDEFWNDVHEAVHQGRRKRLEGRIFEAIELAQYADRERLNSELGEFLESTICSDLTILKCITGKWEEAEHHFLQIQKKRNACEGWLPEDDSNYFEALYSYAAMKLQIGCVEDVCDLLHTGLQEARRCFGEEHIWVSMLENRLADAYVLRGDLKTGSECRMRAAAALKKIDGNSLEWVECLLHASLDLCKLSAEESAMCRSQALPLYQVGSADDLCAFYYGYAAEQFAGENMDGLDTLMRWLWLCRRLYGNSKKTACHLSAVGHIYRCCGIDRMAMHYCNLAEKCLRSVNGCAGWERDKILEYLDPEGFRQQNWVKSNIGAPYEKMIDAAVRIKISQAN